MKKNNLLFLLTAFLILVISCQRNVHTTFVAPVHLKTDTVVAELNDSFFISPHVKSLDCSGDNLYYTDYKDGLVILDSNYRLKKLVGNYGLGPGELVGASCFHLSAGDTIYILNEGKHAVELYNDNQYVKSLPFPQDMRLAFNTRFFTYQNRIYHSVITDTKPIVAFTATNHFLLGTYNSHDNTALGRHVSKHLVLGDSVFYSIGAVVPTLEQYSLDGKLLKSFDLSIIPQIECMMKRYHDSPQSPQRYFTIIQDAYYLTGKLYLLLGLIDHENYSCNHLAVIDVSTPAWKYVQHYILSDDVYSTFCIDYHNIYAFNQAKSTIDVFKTSAAGS